VTLTVTNANGSDSEVKSSYISVSMPAEPAVTGDLRCGPGTVNLSASGSHTLKWYAAASGGAAINTGTTYAPSISATTTYYVADEQIKPVQKVGEPNNSKTGGYLSTPDRKLIFDVLSEVIIKSVVIYANSPGNRIIEVWSNAAVIVATKTVSVPAAGMNRVTLDFTLPAGKDYSMKLAANTPASDLYRNNGGGLSYPYTISSLVSIKTTDASGAGIVPTNYYYYFYDWEVQGAPCYSSRVPVTGTVQTCSGVGAAQETDNVILYPNPVHNILSVQGQRSSASVKIEITNVLGKIVAGQSVSAGGDFTASFDLSNLSAGMYWVCVEADGKKNFQWFVKE
jgi:PKD repeat protein